MVAALLTVALVAVPAGAAPDREPGGFIEPPGTGAPDRPAPPAPFTAQTTAAPCSRGYVALTFDDGPHRVHTPAVLSALAAYDTSATFFVVGQNVAAYPSLVRTTHQQGHVIANHTWRHDNLPSLSDAGIRSTLARTTDAVTRLGIPKPSLVRPPGGATNARVRGVIAAMGLRQSMWAIDPQDWRTGRSATEIATRVLAELHDGANVVMHDGVANSGATAAALPRIITEARRRGFCFGTLDKYERVVPRTPVMTITGARVPEGKAGTTTTAELQVSLDVPARTTVSADYATADGSAVEPYDYRARAGTLEFAPGQVRKAIRVTVNGDDFHQGDRAFTVRLRAVKGAEAAVASARVVIVDDDPPCPPAPAAVLPRLAGTDRIHTAVVISRATFGEVGAAAAVLARDRDFADALAGVPLAVHANGPLLLTASDELDPRVADELDRVVPMGATVYLLGGPAALHRGVEERIAELGYSPVRLGGDNRYATAVAVAEQGLGRPTTVLLATGRDFADALSAGAAAPRVRGAVLLTHGRTMPPETARYLRRDSVTRVYAVGGAAAAAAPTATKLAGKDRYGTARTVAERLFRQPTVYGLTSGERFADALAGGAHIGRAGGPLLLTRPATLPAPVLHYLNALDADGFVYGGTRVVHEPVRACAAALR